MYNLNLLVFLTDRVRASPGDLKSSWLQWSRMTESPVEEAVAVSFFVKGLWRMKAVPGVPVNSGDYVSVQRAPE